MSVCRTCHATKPLEAFEITKPSGTPRHECKECRKGRRKATVQARPPASATPNAVTKPKACSECGLGAPDVDFQWRTDLKTCSWRPICYACVNAKGYSEEHRARERSKDEAAYLRKNAAQHLAWAHRNPENVRQQQVKTASDARRKIATIRTSAGARGVAFEERDVDAMAAKLSQPCHYCAFDVPEGDVLNGIDRVDNATGYSDANTVPCCATCNAMKGPLQADAFVHNVRRIAEHHRIGATEGVPRTRLAPFSGSAELREAKKTKDKTDHLPEGAAVALWSSQCHLCGRSPAMGIDRMDSNGTYVPANVFPCCTDCNYMKKHHVMSSFLDHVGFVNEHTRRWVIADVANIPMLTCGGNKREPVAVLGDGGHALMVFPSIGCASMLIGVHTQMLQRALEGELCRGHTWANVHPCVYKAQHIAPEDALKIISSLR